MKPLIYAKIRPHSKIYEEDRLRKSTKGSLEAVGVEYTTSVFDDYDIVHFINVPDIRKISDAKEANLPVVVSALYCENVHKSAVVTFKNDCLKLHSRYRKALSLADIVLVPGIEMQKFLIDQGVTSNVVVFEPPINLDHFKIQNEMDRTLFFRYFTEREGTTYVLSIGDYANKVEMKNLMDIANLCQNIKFYFFGANYHVWRSKSVKDAPSNIVLSDLVESDIFRSALMNSKVLLFLDPKKKEVTNIAEAMAAKIQVIGFTDPHANESVLKNGENCYLCTGVYDLAKCLENYLKGKLKPTTKKAYAIASKFDLKKSGQKLIKIYKSLLDEK